jgi:hypothetical protein
MRKTLAAMAAAAIVATSTLAMPSTAEARWGWRGPAFFGGVVAGALLGGALVSPYYYAPRSYYVARPYAFGPYPYYGSCWRRWYNGYRWIQARYC